MRIGDHQIVSLTQTPELLKRPKQLSIRFGIRGRLPICLRRGRGSIRLCMLPYYALPLRHAPLAPLVECGVNVASHPGGVREAPGAAVDADELRL